ncbi:matrixin family metalloprotease [Arthrobacter sp. MPF02]|uniref:matrixin family metalloprotease n=1 Tax=Arthrobacter sp. MPF02 TaxID=3388492 RepID=UPI003984A981
MLEAQRYLSRYGYLSDVERTAADEDLLTESISVGLRRFQRFARLRVTGTLTLETLKLMRQPRCPIPDFQPEELGGPGVEDSDPFVFSTNVWAERNLRWFLQTGTPDLTDEAAAVQRAFDTWAAQVPLTFTQVTSAANADFTVEWLTGDHGDGSPFDGSGSGGFNIYAHAFYPEDGRIHFDEAESWAHSHGSGNVDLESVALHEVGHALGLRHSGLSDAVMYFAINSQRRTLHEADIRGIKSRYPPVVAAPGQRAITVPVWALKNAGGSGTVQVDLGTTRRVLAWGQVTMVDSLIDADRDNAWAIEVFDVDGDRPGGFIFGGDHFGSEKAPCNVYSGAFTGRARRITFRATSIHTFDLDIFGTGTILLLDDPGGIG